MGRLRVPCKNSTMGNPAERCLPGCQVQCRVVMGVVPIQPDQLCGQKLHHVKVAPWAGLKNRAVTGGEDVGCSSQSCFDAVDTICAACHPIPGWRLLPALPAAAQCRGVLPIQSPPSAYLLPYSKFKTRTEHGLRPPYLRLRSAGASYPQGPPRPHQRHDSPGTRPAVSRQTGTKRIAWCCQCDTLAAAAAGYRLLLRVAWRWLLPSGEV